jgi:subtilisin family serine protease
MPSLRGRLLLSLSIVLGCGGGGDGPGTAESSPDPRHNVLVIDDGFDITVPVFKGRFVAGYSIICQHSARVLQQDDLDGGLPQPVTDGGSLPVPDDGGAPDTDGGLASRKADLIAALKVRDTSCHLEQGLVPKPDPLASIDKYRERWNATILASKYASSTFTPAEIDEIKAAMDNLGDARFHGTATAGLVAHDNPSARLVLVEERLGSAESAEMGFNCFKQQDIDDNVALFSDPEVRQAYIDQPSSQLEDDIMAVGAQHHVGVVNESFGAFSRQRLEQLQMSKGCTPVDLKPYFTLIGDLDAARTMAHPDPSALVVKSAGNDHSQLDGPADNPMCNMDGSPRLVVAAYDNQGQLTDFTNFGKCVDTSAPGSQIIAPIPGNWYLPLSGTSFSAPLTARLISLNPQPIPYSADQARAQVLAMRDDSGRIPISRFPKDVLYDPQMQANMWALRLAEPAAFERPLINVRKLREFERLLRLGKR